jgi:hypothetical protein
MMSYYHRKDRRRSKLGKKCRGFQETAVSIPKINKIITQTQNTKAITTNKYKTIIKDHLVKDTIKAIMGIKMKNNQEEIKHPIKADILNPQSNKLITPIQHTKSQSQ